MTHLIEQFALFMYILQLAHSLEELLTGFHKKWFLFKMPFWIFLTFEIIHNIFWGVVLFLKTFPYREELLVIFILLMFANGIEHIIWACCTKKYVPGLVTAPVHVILFFTFCYLIMFK